MTSFFGELRRRNVVRVAVAYAIVGWVLIEVSTTVLPVFEAPDWIAQVFTFFVILGFPLALILSWAYDLTPQGVVRADSVPLSERVTKVTGRKLDFAIIGALVLALGFVVYNYESEDSDQEAAVQETTPTVGPTAETPAAVEIQRDVLPNSVAVLPFDNLSPNADDAYFAAGLHDEILSQLAKLRNLSVISRTSMLRYADSDLSIPEIARELNVETVMEGSVRYADGRVRITTQLIDAATDEHLWSETYEREFSDIFAIESDIAMNIANAVGAEFSLEEQESIEKIPTESPAAYALYLRALIPATPSELRVQYLDRAIALDSEFALAYALNAFTFAASFAATEETERVVRENAERALMLDPTIGLAHAALGILHESHWRGADAQREFERAYQLSPNDPDVMTAYGGFKRYTGDYAEAIRTNRRAVELDPNTRFRYTQLSASYLSNGDYDAAVNALQRSIELAPAVISSYVQLARAEATRGNAAEALEALELAEQLDPNPLRLAQIAVVYGRIDRPGDAERLFAELEAVAQETPLNDALWAMAYSAVGDYEQARERLANAIDNQVSAGTYSFESFRVPFTSLKSNDWRDPELDRPAFRELRDRIFALN